MVYRFVGLEVSGLGLRDRVIWYMGACCVCRLMEKEMDKHMANEIHEQCMAADGDKM